ncbi:MAG: hypothetical protein DIZ80_15055 [endosymbiont of Galathealinum brachiosum]|uniref:Uncharacterized protein n=1 Tax=endosymbiont of Galathealinum brachiosum TaxID=2200906 RepID=A0A370D934_9GAMM|nr:MAG: hypothetical protein DIZ80_15055 [endosymbiont of Galathealinum brachiosum]
MNITTKIISLFLSILLYSSNIFSGQAIIEKVEAECNYKRLCKFNVTIRHADEGWTHFANGWQIFTPNGDLIGHRALAHPHVNEQPFTRSIRNIKIPANVDTAILIANDSVHGKSDRKYVIKLTFTDY